MLLKSHLFLIEECRNNQATALIGTTDDPQERHWREGAGRGVPNVSRSLVVFITQGLSWESKVGA